MRCSSVNSLDARELSASGWRSIRRAPTVAPSTSDVVLELQYSQLPYIQRESRLCRYLEQYRVRSLLFEQRLQPLAARGHGRNIL